MAVFTVTSLADAGAGSLRAAITAANADGSGSPTVIEFAVGGTITLASDLPALTHTVSIDATTVPGHTSGGAPVVALDCNGQAGISFDVGAQGSQLLGLAIGNANGNGVTLNAGTITLNDDRIGFALDGSALGNSGDGVHVTATSANNQIGVNPAVAGAAQEVVTNVISNNGGNGISLHGSAQNTIVGNRIGTDPTGTTAMANGANGIWVTGGSDGNEIGGIAYIDAATGEANDPTGDKNSTAPAFVVPPQGNLISGNTANGVLIDAGSQNNELNGNFIGTTASGNSALGNGSDGVLVSGSDGNSLIGCDVTQNPFVYYNVVGGNGANGIEVLNSDDTTIQADFFGIGADNTSIVGNALDGVLVDGSSSDTQFGGVIPLGNVTAGNGTNGIEVKDTASGFTSFNTFGGLVAFKGAAANGNDGILITATGGDQVLQTSVFSGNGNNGIEIGGNASGVTLDPDFAGTDTTGSAAVPNGNDGLLIDGTAHDITVGGQQTSVMPRSVYSGNDGYGIAIIGNAHDVQVVNAYVGTSTDGTVPLGNGLGGILVGGSASDNTIGGPLSTPTRPNTVLVSANDGNGITLAAGTTGSTVINNIIGFEPNGLPLLNTGTQLADDGTGSTISGNTIACFAVGTRLRTAQGDVAVESLVVGTRLRTRFGRRMQRIVWIGQRTIDCARHPAPARVQPVRIAAGAFGRGRPARDLFLSPDHAVFIDGALIPVRLLVNGDSIVQVPVARATYHHVELARHDVVFAEDLPVESYLDTGNRDNFANSGLTTRLHPDFAAVGADATLAWEAACAPLVVTGPLLAAVRRKLARRRAPTYASTRPNVVAARMR